MKEYVNILRGTNAKEAGASVASIASMNLKACNLLSVLDIARV